MPESKRPHTPAGIDSRLAELEIARRSPSNPHALLSLLTSLEQAAIDDIDELVRFHNAILFLRAYPQSPAILRKTDALLDRFVRRVRRMARSQDIEPLSHPEASGIAGTWVRGIFSLDKVRWLDNRFPGRITIDWEAHEDTDKLAPILTTLFPLLGETASIDANVPHLQWIEAAGVMANKDRGLDWLVRSLDRLPIDEAARAALFDSLAIWILWQLDDLQATRTNLRRSCQSVFYQKEPLLTRRDVSLATEIAGDDLPVRRLSRAEGELALDMSRIALAVRYRELYGFTYGDPGAVLSAQAGRGLEILIVGLHAEKRLPIRAGFGVMLVRNGVPIGYGDAYGLGERLEVSLNIFYSFRDGESAFCWARILKLYNQIFGSTTFSIDPYQIGHGNEEAIESGAFWFYRKLGFRSTDPDVDEIARREETRIAKRSSHRTSARTLRRMAESSLLYEVAGTAPGAWDDFHTGNIGLAVQRAMARSGQDAVAFRQACVRRVAAALSLHPSTLALRQRRALEALAPVLALIHDLDRWTPEEKDDVLAIVRAKSGRFEEKALQLVREHKRLKGALRRLGNGEKT